METEKQNTTEMLRIAICDDRLRDRQMMERMLDSLLRARELEAEVTCFENGESLLEAMRQHCFDILFLDIFMDSMTGLETAEMLRTFSDCAIVFVTTTPDYALEGFEVNATHYLVKPCTEEMVDKALERCLKHVSVLARTIEIRTGREVVTLRQNDINYIEVFGNLCVVHTIAGKLETYTPLGILFEKLDSTRFVYPHRSYVVNLGYIGQIPGAQMVLEDGTSITVSRSERANMRQRYLEYVLEKARGKVQ